jgi:hypothetical protein
MATSAADPAADGRLPPFLARKAALGVVVGGSDLRGGSARDAEVSAVHGGALHAAAAAALDSQQVVVGQAADDGRPDAASTDALLDGFDLREGVDKFHKHDLDWVQHAMVQASRIRFGHWTQLVWWGADKTRHPLRQLAADTGVYAFEVSPTNCQRLLTYLEDPGSYSKDGFLKLAGTTWPGYNNYGLVHAVDGVDTHLQERLTVRVGNLEQVDFLLQREAMIRDIAQEVTVGLGGVELRLARKRRRGEKALRAMHLLRQDVSEQASFALHSDANDLRHTIKGDLEEMTTAIVNLTDEISAMRMWGMAPAVYRGQGHSVAFPGAALHESLRRAKGAPAHKHVWKLAMFFC